MVDFCTKCAERLGHPCAEIQVEEIADSLAPGYAQPVLCEGCGMIGVVKLEDGSVILHYMEPIEGQFVNTETLKEYLE